VKEERSEIPHVLLVYPLGSERRGMVEALGELSASLETADHLFTAISRFTARPADVVVLGLAALDDRDVERAIPLFRDLRPDVHLLLAFPPRRRESAVKALGLGADAYVLEPFYLRELVDLVRRGLLRKGPAITGETTLEDQDLEKLAGAIGHAVGNPLQIIEFQLSQDVIEAEEVRQETKRIAAVAEELLAYARQKEMQAAVLDVNRLVKETVPLTGKLRKRFHRELAGDLPAIDGDARQIRLAFSTFAGMADARGSEERLRVETAESADGWVEIVFHAPDLHLTPEEERDFFREFSALLAGEVGLRAATAKGIILSHGGEVVLASLGGEGTTVTVRLPVNG